MIKIYEKGDIVEIHDDVDAPNELAAMAASEHALVHWLSRRHVCRTGYWQAVSRNRGQAREQESQPRILCRRKGGGGCDRCLSSGASRVVAEELGSIVVSTAHAGQRGGGGAAG